MLSAAAIAAGSASAAAIGSKLSFEELDFFAAGADAEGYADRQRRLGRDHNILGLDGDLVSGGSYDLDTAVDLIGGQRKMTDAAALAVVITFWRRA